MAAVFMSDEVELADVLSRLSYDDRMAFAKFIAECAADWAKDGNVLDTEYYASLMSSYVELIGVAPEIADTDEVGG